MNENRKPAVVYLVVPCYNEEEILEMTVKRLKNKMMALTDSGRIHPDSKVMFVNDGSTDGTWRMICGYCKEDSLFAGLSLSANFGHQNAILAGMMAARECADAVITIDADLQQDIEALDRFLDCYYEGCEIVYGIRNDRKSDSVLKKTTATLYYKILHWLGCDIMTNHADYRLMSRKALDALGEFREVNLFLRGLIPMLGFRSDVVYFDVKAREAGHSKYTMKKMMLLAVNGITSLSIRPLHLITGMGLLATLGSIVLCIISINEWLHGLTVPGYTTTLIVTLVMSGLILLSLGIMGEYIGKIYMESKGRPRYLIDSVVWKKEGSKAGRHTEKKISETEHPEERDGKR